MWILFLELGVLLCLQKITECLKCASITFSCSTATASDTTGPGGPSDVVVIGIPTIFVSLLGILVAAVVTVCGVWCTNKKKGDPRSPSY